MSPEFYSRTWSVGQFKATLSCPPLQPGAFARAVISWDPYLPKKPLSTTELGQYAAGLAAAAKELEALLLACKAAGGVLSMQKGRST